MPTKDEMLIERLNALIMLAQWNRRLPLYAARLFAKSQQYNDAVALLRAADKKKPVPPTPGDALIQDEWKQLYEVTANSDSTRALFANDSDPLDGATAEEISQLAEVADLTTDRKKTFSTR